MLLRWSRFALLPLILPLAVGGCASSVQVYAGPRYGADGGTTIGFGVFGGFGLANNGATRSYVASVGYAHGVKEEGYGAELSVVNGGPSVLHQRYSVQFTTRGVTELGVGLAYALHRMDGPDAFLPILNKAEPEDRHRNIYWTMVGLRVVGGFDRDAGDAFGGVDVVFEWRNQ